MYGWRGPGWRGPAGGIAPSGFTTQSAPCEPACITLRKGKQNGDIHSTRSGLGS